MRNLSLVCSLLIAGLGGAAGARAETTGPDYWDVAGVRSNDVLNLRAQANADSAIIARIPYNARGIRNLGCAGIPTFQEWLRMSEAERTRSARARWCQVEYDGKTGWVAGRFLMEGSPPGAKGR